MIKVIALLLTSIFLVGTTYANKIEYNNEYGDLCREQLMEQVLSSPRTIDLKLKTKIDGLMTKIDAKYSDEKLYLINNKIITILNKTSKDSKKFNIYTYFLLKLDQITNHDLHDEAYIKGECGLLMIPLNYNKMSFSKRNKVSIESKKITTKNSKKLEEKANKLGLSKKEVNEMVIRTNEKYKKDEGPSVHIKHRKSLRKAVKENNDKIKDKEHLSLSTAVKEKEQPYGLDRDVKYDLGLTEKEQIEYDGMDEKFMELAHERADVKSKIIVGPYSRDYGVKSESEIKWGKELAKIDTKIKKLNYRKVELIKFKWERKNLCIMHRSYGAFYKDRDTFKSISLINGSEEEELRNDFYHARYYGYNLDCKFFSIYPELNISDSELKKLSKSALKSKLAKGLSFKPTKTNYNYKEYPIDGKKYAHEDPKFPYGRPFTGFEQATEDYTIAKQMLNHIYLPKIAEKEGRTSIETKYRDIPSYYNKIYFDRY